MSTAGKVRVETASEIEKIEKPSPLSEKPNNYTTAPRNCPRNFQFKQI
jgi:hypothetical protein